MLKDSEAVLKRRKLSLTTTTTTTTPPTTPPTPPPLNMMMMTTTPTTTPLMTPTSTASTGLAATHAGATSALTHDMSPPTLSTMAATPMMHATNPTASAEPTTPTNSNAAAAGSAVPDHYSLRWNNHQSHILRAFDALLQTKTLVDVTLVCAETSIRAHKMVLSACSPFFQRVFAETPCKHPVIVLKDFRGWVVQAIVDFMYRGEISVPQERLQTLIQAGESLQVRGLVESSVPEHTPTPAASPDDFAMLDSSLLSSELERCSSFDDESPSMVTAGSKVILPSRLFCGATARRERERKRERERGRELEREAEPIMSDHETLNTETNAHPDLCTSPMPRRKQARPRRRSGELPHELTSKPASPAPATEPDLTPEKPATVETAPPMTEAENLATVIKRELIESMEEEGEQQGRTELNEREKFFKELENERNQENAAVQEHEHDLSLPTAQMHGVEHKFHDQQQLNDDHEHVEHDEFDDDDEVDDHEDIEELINTSTELRRKSNSGLSDGPEDLCTTKKESLDNNGANLSGSSEECSASAVNNNNNNSKLNNNNRIVLSLKDIRHLNKPSSGSSSSDRHSSTPNSASGMNPFAAASLRDLRLDRSGANCQNVENQCKMEALEAQMHAAAAAAAAAAASGENPFQHMEHQMDLSFAAAAAAAAVSHQQNRERDQQMQREQREMQQHHNAYANSLLGQMGMPGMPPFGPGGPGGPPGGPSAHERLEESMNRLSKEFTPSSPMSLPSHFNPPDGPPHPPSPLPFPGMSSALTLTPPHMFGLDSPLGLFPPGIDPGKLYNPLMEMSDPRGMGGEPQPFLKKKMPRPKGQHSAPRGGPPRSWTNAELTEALQHVWNKKMTTSQASRIFGIPYNSLLMYVRGKYGKSLKLEQLRKDCISGPPLELLQMGISSGGGSGKNSKNNNSSSGGGGGGGSGGSGANNNNNNNPLGPNEEGRDHERDRSEKRKDQQQHQQQPRGGSADMDLGPAGCPPSGPGMPRSASSEPDLLGGPNSLFNPFPPGFYPEFPGGFPGLPLSMLNLLPPSERHQHAAAAAAAMHHMTLDEDCKSDRSKQSSSMDEDAFGAAAQQPLALNRELAVGGGCGVTSIAQQNGGAQD